MVFIDIISGFLGAGKTTLIKKLIQEAYVGEKVVLIENEFGEIGVDGGFMQEAGIQVTEMNSGCICCSLVGDFSEALKKVASEYAPDRIIIEPSGVGKLSDVKRAVEQANVPNSKLNAFSTVVDAKKCKTYLKNFGEFFLDQIKHANCIILSHTDNFAKTKEACELLRAQTNATIVTTAWNLLTGKELLNAMEKVGGLEEELKQLACETHEHHHEHGECCHHSHEHHHEHGECCHHGHEHHHEHGECCHHSHEHHHHADEIFMSWGVETGKTFTQEDIKNTLLALDSGKYGTVLRAKGIVDGGNEWIYFDYVPEEPDLRTGAPMVTGRLCVIGCQLDEEGLKQLFLG